MQVKVEMINLFWKDKGVTVTINFRKNERDKNEYQMDARELHLTKANTGSWTNIPI